MCESSRVELNCEERKELEEEKEQARSCLSNERLRDVESEKKRIRRDTRRRESEGVRGSYYKSN